MSALQVQLEESHKDLFQWFLFLQESLLLANDKHAKKAFEVFSVFFQAHLAFENQYLLNSTSIEHEHLQWKPLVYQKEHEKLLRMLESLKDELLAYFQLSGRHKRLALLDVLANQQVFRRVMEHHELREEQDLFLHLEAYESLSEKWSGINVQLHTQFAKDKDDLKAWLQNS